MLSIYCRCLVILAMVLGAGSFSLAQQTSTVDLSLPATDDGLPGAGPIRRADWFDNLNQLLCERASPAV